MNILYSFFAEEGLIFLKRGYLPFKLSLEMPEPWLKEGSVYRAEKIAEISDQEFSNYLRDQYANLPNHLKDIVTFEYFEQQSQRKREEIEKTLLSRKSISNQGVLRNGEKFSPDRLNGWRILSLFEDWRSMHLWQFLAAEGKGLVMEISVSESGFKELSYNQQAQHLAPVNQVGSWLPKDDLYYLFNRPISSAGTPDFSEWRLLRHSDSADRKVNIKGMEKVMYRLPTKAVRRVIMGYRCESDYCKEVKHYLSQDINYRHTECVQAQLNPNTLKFELVTID